MCPLPLSASFFCLPSALFSCGSTERPHLRPLLSRRPQQVRKHRRSLVALLQRSFRESSYFKPSHFEPSTQKMPQVVASRKQLSQGQDSLYTAWCWPFNKDPGSVGAEILRRVGSQRQAVQGSPQGPLAVSCVCKCLSEPGSVYFVSWQPA